jgi:hypothetical protein
MNTTMKPASSGMLAEPQPSQPGHVQAPWPEDTASGLDKKGEKPWHGYYQ